VLNDMKNISDDQNIYLSSLLELETNGKIKTIKIMGEYWTLANLISRYCFIVTEENIKFVAPSIIHPDKRIGVVRIIHSNFSKVIQDAI